jgi:membrane protein implicated in regulation of membrane protease activity
VGWAVAAFDLPAWAWGAAALPIAKDLLLYPAARKAFGPPQVGSTVLIGAPARAVEALAPSGYVRVRGELWQAVLADAAARAPAGAVLVVRAVRGLTLVVEPAPRGDG